MSNHAANTPESTTEAGMTAEQVIALMPKDASTFEALMAEFVSTVPPGTPEPAVAMMRRVFIAGAAAVLDQIHTQITAAFKSGNDAAFIDTLNGLGVGVQVAMETENQRVAELTREAEVERDRRVIAIKPVH